jgi:hypothetical protein
MKENNEGRGGKELVGLLMFTSDLIMFVVFHNNTSATLTRV